MVKNYLIGAVRPVIKKWFNHTAQGAVQDNENRDHDLELYEQMYQISRTSARRHLAGHWQEICHRAPCLDARMFQISQWYLIKELWFSEQCNILCMGSDTLFARPTDIFDTWSDMRLFNYTDPRHHPEFPHYFNDDVRYLPHTMDPEIWNLAERRMTDWFTHAQAHWDCGQLINNAMFWHQPLADSDRLHPYLNFMAHGVRSLDLDSITSAEQWNHCSIDDAHIIHFNGSRGAASTVETMKLFAKHFEILT